MIRHRALYYRGMRPLTALLVLGLGVAARAPAQVAANRPLVDRATLTDMLARTESDASSSALSSEARQAARRQAELIRVRLEEGDFRVGDRVALIVENEEALTDTFTVDVNQQLPLPDVGPVSLRGVLRAELRDTVVVHLSRFLRDPRVQAEALVRISILGAVAAPGFYPIASNQVVSDALMTAGGPLSTAEMDAIRIERSGEPVWEGEALQAALAEGRTVDQMSLQAGDQIVIPDQGTGIAGGEGVLRTVALLLSIPLAIVAVIQIF